MRSVPFAVRNFKTAYAAEWQGNGAGRKKEKKLQKVLDTFYMDGAVYLGKYIGMNVYKKNRMQNVLNAAGFKMSPETYMAYAYLKAGSAFLLILPALYFSRYWLFSSFC